VPLLGSASPPHPAPAGNNGSLALSHAVGFIFPQCCDGSGGTEEDEAG
jgi:hypothetical protein